MRVTILVKLLTMMLVLTLIPLAIMGYIALQDEKAIGANAVENARAMGIVATNDSTYALNQLGEELIKQKSQEVTKEMDLYIRDHPTLTIAQLQADPIFSKLALQPVGKTGYTGIHNAKTRISYFHINPKIIGSDLNSFEKTNPQFFSHLKRSENFTNVSGPYDWKDSWGYYDWKDADGVIRAKFGYWTVVPTATADGVRLQTGATTYIDEFSAPAKSIEQKMKVSTEKTIDEIKVSTESMSSGNTILMITLISMILVIIVSIIFATMISRPIRQLTHIADEISMGNLDNKVTIQTNDEINDLAESFKRMINAFKMMVSMQEAEGEEKR